MQDGGKAKTTNRYTRLLQYDISGKPKLVKEFVVPLPQFNDVSFVPIQHYRGILADGCGMNYSPQRPRTHARQHSRKSISLGIISSLFFLETLLVALERKYTPHEDKDECREVSADKTTIYSLTESKYRQIDVFDLSSATNILPKDLFSITTSPTSGTLISGINPAKYCPFLNFNDNAQLARFGLHNGGGDDQNLLNSKWESIAVLPLDSEDGKDDEYLVLSVSDNDFITQDGRITTGGFTYKDASGLNLDNQALLFKVKLPRKADVLVG